MNAIFEHAPVYLATGGVLMIPLLALAVTMWFLITLRVQNLRAIGDRPPRFDGEPGDPVGALRAQIARLDLRARLGRHRRAIRTIAAVAPLIGLLGTVRGMIATFEAMTNTATFLHASSGGVAGGISEALVTTQVGLFVAIPGLFVGRLLDQRERRLRGRLDRSHAEVPV